MVKALISHAMETGQRKDKKTGKKIPAHFIQEVTCSHNGNTVLLLTGVLQSLKTHTCHLNLAAQMQATH